MQHHYANYNAWIKRVEYSIGCIWRVKVLGGIRVCDGGSGVAAVQVMNVGCGLWLWLWACAAIWDKFMQDSRVVYDQKYYVFSLLLFFVFFFYLILRDYHFTWRVIYGLGKLFKILAWVCFVSFSFVFVVVVVLSVLLWKFSSLFDSRGNSLDLAIQLEINVNFFSFYIIFFFFAYHVNLWIYLVVGIKHNCRNC